MLKKISSFLLITIILFSGCLEPNTEPTGGAVAIKEPTFTKEDYAKSFQDFVEEGKQFSFLKTMQTSYKMNGTTHYSDVTEKVSAKNPNTVNGVAYTVEFDSPIVFGETSVPIIWFHEKAELVPSNSKEVTIVKKGVEIKVKNFNQYKGKWNAEFLFNTNKTALKGIKIYNTAPIGNADYTELYS